TAGLPCPRSPCASFPRAWTCSASRCRTGCNARRPPIGKGAASPAGIRPDRSHFPVNSQVQLADVPGRAAMIASMTNMYQPPGGAPPESGPEPPSGGEHGPKGRSKALRWTYLVAAAGLLAAAGVIGGVTLAGHSSPAAPTGSAPGGPAGQ